jgi:phosphoglycolate phosphatase
VSRAWPELVIFDLAGTTMLDDGFVAKQFRETLASGGILCSEDQIASVRGATKQEAFRRLAKDPEHARRLCETFLASLRRHCAEVPCREVPGATGTFAWLRREGVKVALNAGFEAETVRFLLGLLEWEAGTFHAVVCGDDVPAGRPDPAMIQTAMRRTGVSDPARVMVVGDTVLDLQAGTAACAGWVVGVTSGAHDHARLMKTPHTHLLASVEDLRALLHP